MKSGIHPELKKAVIECACGNKMETFNTVGDLKVEICSVCHPFFSGKQKLIDTAGRVDKFKARLEKAQNLKENAPKKAPRKTNLKQDTTNAK